MLAIKQIEVKNFRSIQGEVFPLTPFSALIGKNDAGKSNLLEAIRLLFQGSAADVDVEDFYDPTAPLEISAYLGGVTEYLELCDEQNKPKIQKLIDGEGGLTIRRMADKPRGLGKLEIYDPADKGYKSPTGIDAPLKAMLPEVIYIEALADVGEELKGTQKDALGRLVGRVIAPVTEKVEPELEQAYAAANTKLNVQSDGSDKRVQELKDIETEITKYLHETFPRDTVRLKVTLPSVKEILAKVDVFVADGKAMDPYYRKGQGLQRALYLSLLRAIAGKIREAGKKKVTQPFILLFEEPEAFLHPAGQGKMRAALETISSGAQVVISTHSPLMVTPQSIQQATRIEKRLEAGLPKPVTRRYGPVDPTKLTENQKTLLRLFSLQRSSRFLFSRGVLLVEGDGDEHLVKAIVETCGGMQCDDCEISLVEVGGKDHIASSVEILRMLGLQVWSVVDLDFLWRGAGAVLGADPDLSQLVEEAKKLAKWDEIPEDDKDERRSRMTEAVCGQLAAKRDVVLERLRKHNIFVLRRGEIERYVGLGRNSKGEYLKASSEVRSGDRKIADVEDFSELLTAIKAWMEPAVSPAPEAPKA